MQHNKPQCFRSHNICHLSTRLLWMVSDCNHNSFDLGIGSTRLPYSIKNSTKRSNQAPHIQKPKQHLKPHPPKTTANNPTVALSTPKQHPKHQAPPPQQPKQHPKQHQSMHPYQTPPKHHPNTKL